MSLTIDDLFTTFDAETCKQRLLDRCAAKNLPISDWEPGGVARTLIEIEAQENADFSSQQVNLARGAFLATSMSDNLTLIAKDFFQVEREAATKYRFRLCMGNNGMNPIVLEAGKVWIQNDQGYRFVLDSTEEPSYTLPVQGIVYPPFVAESAGVEYNQLPSQIITPIPGLYIGSVDETISVGKDAESDASLTTRCLQKWSTLNALATNDDAIKYYCTTNTFSGVVTRVKPVTSVSGSGLCTVYVAGPDGALSAGDVNNLQAYLQAKVGQANTILVYSATNLTFNVQANIRLKTGATTQAKHLSEASAAIAKLVRSLEIGQTLYTSQILECLMLPDGVISATLTSPSSDLIPTSTQVCNYTNLITSVTYV